MRALLILCVFWASETPAQRLAFHLSGIPQSNQQVEVYGSIAPLSWEKGIPLKSTGEGYYSLDITLSSEAEHWLEYKYRIGQQWEAIDENRLVALRQAATQSVDQWGVRVPLNPQQAGSISVEQMRQDIDLLADAFKTLHPGLYRYQTPEAFSALVTRIKASVSKAVSHREAHTLLTRLAAAVRCGHTHTNPWNQGKLIKALVYQQADRLPLSLRWINRRLWVEQALNETGLRRGDEILAINQIDTPELLSQMLLMTSADGNNDANRISRLQLAVSERPQWFDILLAAQTEPTDGDYFVQVRTLGGDTKNLRLRALTTAQRVKQFDTQGVDQAAEFDASWYYQILENGTGYLRLGTFSIYKMDMDWRAFLDEAFTRFKQQSKSVIIDIRGNGGGMPEVSHYLTSWISDREVAFNPYQQRVVYQRVPERLRPYLRTWDPSIFDIQQQTSVAKGRFYKRKQQQGSVLVQPKAAPYQGKVALLVDGANSSATFTLAREWQRQELATLIGQNTGGSLQGINGGVMFFMTLPGSGVEVDIPLIGYFPAEPQPEKGVVPDVLVTEDPLRWARGEDQTLETAKAWSAGLGTL